MQRLRQFLARPIRAPSAAALLLTDVRKLSLEAHRVAVWVWSRRSANEQASVHLAQRIMGGAQALELPALQCAALARFAADERSHVALAGDVLGVLGAAVPKAQALRAQRPEESLATRHAREVAVGLFVCEAVSASRFASVWRATDLPAFRQHIAIFLRDEVAHAHLGATLLPEALALLTHERGEPEAQRFVREVIDEALAELRQVVAGGLAREALPPLREQPRTNPGVVEPAVDAHAYYRALDRFIMPRLHELWS